VPRLLATTFAQTRRVEQPGLWRRGPASVGLQRSLACRELSRFRPAKDSERFSDGLCQANFLEGSLIEHARRRASSAPGELHAIGGFALHLAASRAIGISVKTLIGSRGGVLVELGPYEEGKQLPATVAFCGDAAPSSMPSCVKSPWCAEHALGNPDVAGDLMRRARLAITDPGGRR
jgi:hypothetical protein